MTTSPPPPPPIGGRQTTPPKKEEPVYESIKEVRPASMDLSSPPDAEFVTPTTSPLFERKGIGRGGKRSKSPDTVSTASSEGDLLKEILKEMDGGPKRGAAEGDEGIYSTLMRKNKGKMNNAAPAEKE
jgi:hypothetical protein